MRPQLYSPGELSPIFESCWALLVVGPGRPSAIGPPLQPGPLKNWARPSHPGPLKTMEACPNWHPYKYYTLCRIDLILFGKLLPLRLYIQLNLGIGLDIHKSCMYQTHLYMIRKSFFGFGLFGYMIYQEKFVSVTDLLWFDPNRWNL